MIAQGLLKRKRLLSQRQATLLEELRRALDNLAAILERFGTDVKPSDIRALRDTLTHLDELFLLVIVGEFNSGKSSFINALLGAPILAEGVTPTTDVITLLRYGDEQRDEVLESSLLERTYPADVLRELTIVDTPGTNAVIRRHEELTHTFIPRADLVLFTTSADRPFTESERVFLAMIKEWGKKIVMVVNKRDILEEGEVEQVTEFVKNNAQKLLGITPDIFPVSARMALRARKSPNGYELWEASHFAEVERYILETLDQEARVRLKLLSPLGVGEHLSRVYLTAVEERLKVLQDDFVTLDNIEQQLSFFSQDLLTDVEYHLKEIDEILNGLEKRGDAFFDEMLRLGRLPDLIKTDRVRTEFEREVVGDVASQIERRIQVLIDWTVEKNLRLWQNITDYISRRRVPQNRDSIIGEVGGTFDYNRNALIESVGNIARDVVSGYDREQESLILAEEIQSSLAATFVTGVGAAGVGALLLVLLKGALLDVTGILFATVLAAGGFFILPAKRRQAKQRFNQRIEDLRKQIRTSMKNQFDKETEQSLSRIRDAISPYTRFVRTKRDQLNELQRNLSHSTVRFDQLRSEIEA